MWTPQDAGFPGGVVAEGVVVEYAAGGGELEPLHTRLADHGNRRKLGIGLADVVATQGGLTLVSGGVARSGDRVGLEATRLIAILGADGQADVAVPGRVGQFTGGVEENRLLLGETVGRAGVADVIEHFLGDGARAAEEVERYAARNRVAGRAALIVAAAVHEARADGCFDAAAHETAFVDTAAIGATEVVGHVPAPVVFTQNGDLFGHLALESDHGAEGVDVLQEVTVAGLYEAAAHVDEVAAERVVDIVARDRQPLRDDEKRRGSQFLVRAAVGVRGLEETANVLAELVITSGENVVALLRSDQVVVGLIVVQIALADVKVAVGAEVAPAGLGIVEAKARGAAATDRGLPQVVAGLAEAVDDGALRGGGAAAGGDLASLEVEELVRLAVGAFASKDVALLVVTSGEQDAALVGGVTGGNAEVVDIAETVTGGADVASGFGAAEIATGDDVDHAADGVGAVHRRGAVLEDLDALDDGGRDGVEVHRRVGAGTARNVAAAVDQNQSSASTEATQADARGSAAAIVELDVDAVGLRREVLQDVADRDEAGGVDFGPVEYGHRSRRVGDFAPNCRTGDDDDLAVIVVFDRIAAESDFGVRGIQVIRGRGWSWFWSRSRSRRWRGRRLWSRNGRWLIRVSCSGVCRLVRAGGLRLGQCGSWRPHCEDHR